MKRAALALILLTLTLTSVAVASAQLIGVGISGYQEASLLKERKRPIVKVDAMLEAEGVVYNITTKEEVDIIEISLTAKGFIITTKRGTIGFFRIVEGSLNITKFEGEEESYEVKKGFLLITSRFRMVLVRAFVTGKAIKDKARLILHGEAEAEADEVEPFKFSVSFEEPRSKLAGLYFIDAKGMLIINVKHAVTTRP